MEKEGQICTYKIQKDAVHKFVKNLWRNKRQSIIEIIGLTLEV